MNPLRNNAEISKHISGIGRFEPVWVRSSFRRRLSSGQLAVFDPVGLVGGSAEPSFPVGFILGIIPRKPDYFAVSLKSQNIGGDPVELEIGPLLLRQLSTELNKGRKY